MSKETLEGDRDLSKWRDDFYWRRVVGAKKPETEEGILRALRDQGIEDEDEVVMILEEMLREEEVQADADAWTAPVMITSEGRKAFSRGGGFH